MLDNGMRWNASFGEIKIGSLTTLNLELTVICCTSSEPIIEFLPLCNLSDYSAPIFLPVVT